MTIALDLIFLGMLGVTLLKIIWIRHQFAGEENKERLKREQKAFLISMVGQWLALFVLFFLNPEDSFFKTTLTELFQILLPWADPLDGAFVLLGGVIVYGVISNQIFNTRRTLDV